MNRALTLILTVLIAVIALPTVALAQDGEYAPYRDQQPAPERRLAPSVIESHVIAETNRVRRARGLAPLALSRQLRVAARGHTRWLARSGAFQHEDARGRPFWLRIERAGYPRNSLRAENIAQTSGCNRTTGRQLVRMWMNSPPHRRNVLNPRLRAIGVGVVPSADCWSVLATANYGSVRTR